MGMALKWPSSTECSHRAPSLSGHRKKPAPHGAIQRLGRAGDEYGNRAGATKIFLFSTTPRSLLAVRNEFPEAIELDLRHLRLAAK